MKSRILKTSIGSTIFLLLIIGGLALMQPIHNRISDFIKYEKANIVNKFREKTGLDISYESLSPSILAGINIRGIILSDIKTNKKIVEINKATLSYNIRDFFSKKPLSAIKELTLKGVIFEYDAVVDREIMENLKVLFNSKNNKEEKKDKTQLAELDIPFGVNLKNISLHYADKLNDYLLSIKDVSIEHDRKVKNGVKISTSGRMDWKTRLLKLGEEFSLISFGFSVTGTFFNDFNGSSALVKLSGNNRADYTVSKLDLFLNYVDEKLQVRTMRSIFPFNFVFEVDAKNKNLKFSSVTQQFNPFSLLKIRNRDNFISIFYGSTVTGQTSLFVEYDEDKINFDSIIFSIDGSADISKKVLGSPIELKLSAFADGDFVTVDNFSAFGEQIEAYFSGSYDLKTKRPSGTFSLGKYELKNGSVLQTEVYIDSYSSGFICFAPQFFMDDRSFTALQLTVLPSNKSWDFTFEFDDYSHVDYEKSGRVIIDGSFITGDSKVVQASISMNDMFMDSVALSSAFFMNESLAEKIKNTSKVLYPYIFSNEIYFSTDFSSFSFNSPFFIIANTQKEGELLTFAVDGSNQTISLSNLDLQFGNQTAHAVASVDFANGIDDFSFFCDLIFNSMPYNFMGNYSSNWLSVNGSFNFDASMSFEKDTEGILQFNSLPVKFGNIIFASSLNSSFNITEKDGISFNIHNFEMEEISSIVKIKPKLAFSGVINKYGFIFDTLAYSDSASVLDGTCNILWNLNEGIFDSFLVDLKANSIINSEKLSVYVEFKNPGRLPFSVDNLKNDFYISGEVGINDFPCARLFSDQSVDNLISANLTASGTINNPFISVNLSESSINFAGYPLTASGIASLDDTGLNANSLNVSWSNFNLLDGVINFNPQKFNGLVSTTLNGNIAGKSFSIPLNIEMSGLSTDNSKDSFVAVLKSEGIKGSLFPKSTGFMLTATYISKNLDIVFGNGNGIRASYSQNGILEAHSGAATPVKFDLLGSLKSNNIDINITNLNANLKTISSSINIPFVKFNNGLLKGAVKISGLTTDPEYTGVIDIDEPEFIIPFVSKKVFKTEKLRAMAGQNELNIKPTEFQLDKGRINIGTRIIFDRWKIDSVDLTLDTINNKYVPLDMGFPYVNVNGSMGIDLDLSFSSDLIKVSGSILGDNSDVSFVTSSLQASLFSDEYFEVNKSEKKESSMNALVNLDIIAGQRVQILFNPLLRGVVVPDTSLKFYMDTKTGDFSLKGDVSLRGGEIVWLNRNFYMKEGRILFNETQDNMDPRLTVRAETRERDNNGNQVTIILSSTNQLLSAFNPILSASPAKSEREIMELMGQVITADSDSMAVFAMAGGDYIVQATVMRGIENALRELCNFDIFSIRTNILQNAVKQSLDKNSANKNMTFGNFFDNSTVYVGKYFGSALYVDALMHWTYDESKLDKDSSVNGLVFQPEFGLEMDSPYVNIRLGVAPDLEALQKSMWIPSTSVTLSWKYSF